MIIYSNLEQDLIHSEEVDYATVNEYVLRITEDNQTRITEEQEPRILEI